MDLNRDNLKALFLEALQEHHEEVIDSHSSHHEWIQERIEAEKLRKEIEALRSWGEQWKNLAKSVIEQNSENLPYIMEDSLFLKVKTYLEHENINS